MFSRELLKIPHLSHFHPNNLIDKVLSMGEMKEKFKLQHLYL